MSDNSDCSIDKELFNLKTREVNLTEYMDILKKINKGKLAKNKNLSLLTAGAVAGPSKEAFIDCTGSSSEGETYSDSESDQFKKKKQGVKRSTVVKSTKSLLSNKRKQIEPSTSQAFNENSGGKNTDSDSDFDSLDNVNMDETSGVEKEIATSLNLSSKKVIFNQLN